MLPVNHYNVTQARARVYQYLRPTLLNEWPLLKQRLGFRYPLKHENHQPTGGGATAAAWKLRDSFKGKTVVGILSGGNCNLRLLVEVCGGYLNH